MAQVICHVNISVSGLKIVLMLLMVVLEMVIGALQAILIIQVYRLGSFSKPILHSTVYVWDDATSAYKSWNGSAGGLTRWINCIPLSGILGSSNGGTGSITISTSHKATSAGTLYRVSDIQESGSVTFNVNSTDFSDQTFISFQSTGEAFLR